MLGDIKARVNPPKSLYRFSILLKQLAQLQYTSVANVEDPWKQSCLYRDELKNMGTYSLDEIAMILYLSLAQVTCTRNWLLLLLLLPETLPAPAPVTADPSQAGSSEPLAGARVTPLFWGRRSLLKICIIPCSSLEARVTGGCKISVQTLCTLST